MSPLEYEDISILLNKAPLHLYHKRYEGLKIEQSPYEIESDAVKRYILSMNSFVKKYTTGKNYNQKQVKKSKEEHDELTGKTFLHEDIYKKFHDITTEYDKNGALAPFLEGGEKLKKVYFQIDGVPCTAEIDIFNPEKNEITFLKATQNAGEAFEREIFKQYYDIEMAFAVEAVKKVYGIDPTCYIVAIEKKPPYVCGIHGIPTDAIELGFLQLQKAIELFKFSEEKGYQNYFGGRARAVSIPYWLNS